MTLHLSVPGGRGMLSALLIFAASASAQPASPLKTLHGFAGAPSDGASPNAGVVLGKGGVLYGVTFAGGGGPCTTNSPGCGTVYSLTPPTTPGGPWTELVLHSFAGGSDGASPLAGVVIGSGGVLYGTTTAGGTYNNGTVFSLTPPASPGGAWTEAVLHNFTGASDGGDPEAGVAIGKGGVLYGTTVSGGSASCMYPASGCGTVFSLKPPASPGGEWIEAVLYNFDGNFGFSAFAGAVTVGDGLLYGMTSEGGTPEEGTIFSLKPPTSPGGGWTEAVLYTFTGGSDGYFPNGGVAIGSGGVLYGTTLSTVFSLTRPTSPGGVWTLTVLYSVGSVGGVVIGGGGVLYGTTSRGGTSENGTVFSLTPPASPGGAWTETVLYNFGGADDGGDPQAGVAIGKEGALYGTTYQGGSSGFGTVFQLKP